MTTLTDKTRHCPGVESLSVSGDVRYEGPGSKQPQVTKVTQYSNTRSRNTADGNASSFSQLSIRLFREKPIVTTCGRIDGKQIRTHGIRHKVSRPQISDLRGKWNAAICWLNGPPCLGSGLKHSCLLADAPHKKKKEENSEEMD